MDIVLPSNMILIYIVGFIVGFVDLSSATTTVDYSPDTCRPHIAGKIIMAKRHWFAIYCLCVVPSVGIHVGMVVPMALAVSLRRFV